MIINKMKKIIYVLILFIILFIGGVILHSFEYMMSNFKIFIFFWLIISFACLWPDYGDLLVKPKSKDDEITNEFDEILHNQSESTETICKKISDSEQDTKDALTDEFDLMLKKAKENKERNWPIPKKRYIKKS